MKEEKKCHWCGNITECNHPIIQDFENPKGLKYGKKSCDCFDDKKEEISFNTPNNSIHLFCLVEMMDLIIEKNLRIHNGMD